jgi:hypothetical protein
VKRVKSSGIGAAQASSRVLVEFEILNRLFAHFEASPNWGVPRAVTAFPEEQVLVTEEVPGIPLMRLIGVSAKWMWLGRRLALPEKYCALSATWLRAFHTFTLQGRGPFNFLGLVRYCADRLDTLSGCAASGVDVAFKEGFLDFLEQRHAAIRDLEDKIVGRHNDYSPHNILVEGDRISVIDFGFYDHDSYLYDLCKFWFQLECMRSSPLYSSGAIDRLQRSFLEGYGSGTDPSDPAFEMVASRYFVTHMATMVTEGIRSGVRGWVDRRSYRWSLEWLRRRIAK